MLNLITLKVLSIFSGIGAFEFVFNLLKEFFNVEVVGYSEIDKYAIKTYEKNFPRIPNLGDAKKIITSKLKDFDILVGGFPCQDFSINGKRKGLEGNRGSLFFELLRILKDKKPKYFIFENVKGLLSQNEGKDFQIILNELENAGYIVKYKVLNAKNFGLPQNRERVFIIGQRKDLGTFDLDIPTTNGNNKAILMDVLDDEVHEKYYKNQKRILGMYNSKFQSERVESQDKVCGCLMVGGSKKSIVLNKDKEFIKRFNNKKLNIHELNDLIIRQLTPNEYERISGFPTGFTSGVSETQRYKQIGNSIAINVLFEVCKSLFQFIKGNQKFDTKFINNVSNKSKQTNLERYKKGFNTKKEKYKNKVLSKLEESAFFEETNEF
ncbi:DNA (cytosine-5-)-methyltransferase [Candidatus Gracilibacteria bacterium]|nr:DNA (cytosine-5-)-methyltransferase [Candidatus Gracilibacteria bacterium]